MRAVAGHVKTATKYVPARSRRRMRRPGVRSLVAAALVVSAGSVALDRMTPAAPRPASVRVVSSAAAHELDVMHAAAAGAPAPRPAASAKSSHHVLAKLLLVHRLVRVHRVFHMRFWWLRRLFR